MRNTIIICILAASLTACDWGEFSIGCQSWQSCDDEAGDEVEKFCVTFEQGGLGYAVRDGDSDRPCVKWLPADTEIVSTFVEVHDHTFKEVEGFILPLIDHQGWTDDGVGLAVRHQFGDEFLMVPGHWDAMSELVPHKHTTATVPGVPRNSWLTARGGRLRCTNLECRITCGDGPAADYEDCAYDETGMICVGGYCGHFTYDEDDTLIEGFAAPCDPGETMVGGECVEIDPVPAEPDQGDVGE